MKTTTNGHIKPAKAKSDAATALEELFEAQLKDIYWAEKAPLSMNNIRMAI